MRVSVFIDGANFFFMQRDGLKWFADPKKMLEYIENRYGEIADAFYYIGKDAPPDARQQAFLSALPEMGFSVVTKQIKTIYDSKNGTIRKKANLDIEIVLDMFIVVAVPQTVFVIALVSVLGASLGNTILALSIVSWTEYCRVTRALVMSLKTNPYVEEGRMGGMSEMKIILKLLLPNVFPYLLVNITQDIGAKLLTLSGLSLLGLASQPPTPEWGYMLSEGRQFMQSAPRLIFYPGMTIVLNVVVFNLLGDSLRDILDPRFTKKKTQRRQMKLWKEST